MLLPETQDSVHDERQARRTPGVATITFGVAIQALTGILVFALPPAGSVTTWLLYLALGLVGLVHLLIGAVLWQQPTPSIGFEGDDVPWITKRCPQCESSIAEALQRGRRRCPACDAHFSTRDIGWRTFDPAGEPVTLSPHERRLGGRHAVTLLAVLATILILLAIYTGVAWPTKPGP